MILYTYSIPNKNNEICIDLKCNPAYNCYHAIPLIGKWTEKNIIKSLITALIIPEKQNKIKATISKLKNGYRVYMALTDESYLTSDEILQEPYREYRLEKEKRRINAINGIKED